MGQIKSCLLTLVVIVPLVLFSSNTFAQGEYFQLKLMKQRQSNREATRWTLADWLDQKAKFALWDQWLAANRSANIFELQLNGGKKTFEQTTTIDQQVPTKIDDESLFYEAAFWIYFVGISVQYEDQEDALEAKTAELKLRLLGTSIQSTNLTIGGGKESRLDQTTKEKWEPTFTTAGLQLYLTSFLGLSGNYKHYFEAKSQNSRALTGSKSSGGVFLEFGVLRLFGEVYQQKLDISSSAQKTKQEQSGSRLGIQLAF